MMVLIRRFNYGRVVDYRTSLSSTISINSVHIQLVIFKYIMPINIAKRSKYVLRLVHEYQSLLSAKITPTRVAKFNVDNTTIKNFRKKLNT